MFVKISILIALAFAAVYPLYFWIPLHDPFKKKFRKHNIALPNIVGGSVLVAVWVLNIPLFLKIVVTLWKVSLLSVSSYSWKKESPDARLMMLPCFFGGYALFYLQAYFVQPGWGVILIGVLSGLAGCSLFFLYKVRQDK